MVNRRESHTQVKRRWDPGRHGGDKKVGGQSKSSKLRNQHSRPQHNRSAPFLPRSRP